MEGDSDLCENQKSCSKYQTPLHMDSVVRGHDLYYLDKSLSLQAILASSIPFIKQEEKGDMCASPSVYLCGCGPV